ncbi:MAG: hypothetical protein DLM53_01670 [Candidatus Eremiobacter antarcticus]|nr:inorganic phosphate transporter [Candidatus Eremiobacteraeota bacterium]MBC5808114.1 inorganic phosphate transporter [Candidatus Eremiobacteraeota bacterium]PZR63513.1 MAG: hypothetical protein DLM53_01670 [Candidatus Eremiobacter sp. RRmetagenome_bin22]
MVAGFNDGGNLLAAATASRTISQPIAFLIIAGGALLGPLLAGTAVAQTVGTGIVDYTVLGILPLSSALAGGVIAVLAAYAARLPTSCSIALFSATFGSLWVLGDLGAIHRSGAAKLLLALFGSIGVGAAAGAIAYILLMRVFIRLDQRAGNRLMRLQYLTIGLQALGYGANDAEKIMGLIVAAMMIGGGGSAFVMPLWVVALAVAAFSLGMAVGGRRVARTIGGKLFAIRPLHALTFQTAAAATVLAASALGGPLSTTETTASAIIGVGAMANPRALRWQIVRELLTAWLLTAPIGFVAGVLLTLALRPFLGGR